MMQRTSFLMLTATCLLALGQVHAQPAATDHDQKVAHAITPTWENDRDLLVMLNEAADRVVFARLIVETSLHEPGLSGRQRYDGLRVAGSSLFHDRQFLEAAAALAQAAHHTQDVREKAEVGAASAEALTLAGPGHAAAALAAFQAAVDAYLSCDLSTLRAAAVESACRRLVHVAMEQDAHTTALTYAGQAVTLAEQGALDIADVGYFRYSAAFAADKNVDHAQAVLLYDKFFDAHAGYMNSQPVLGLMVHALVRRELANGSSWRSPDETLITKIMESLRDPAYTRMPARVNYAEKLAAAWDKQHAADAASALRSELAKLTYPALDALDPADPGDAVLGKFLWRELAVSQLNGAHTLFRRRDDPGGALAFLARITSPSPFASPDLVQEAMRFEQEIDATP